MKTNEVVDTLNHFSSCIVKIYFVSILLDCSSPHCPSHKKCNVYLTNVELIYLQISYRKHFHSAGRQAQDCQHGDVFCDGRPAGRPGRGGQDVRGQRQPLHHGALLLVRQPSSGSFFNYFLIIRYFFQFG